MSARPTRSSYPLRFEFSTRWNDNDVYGHMNNVVYYAYFDSVVNRWMIETGALDLPHGPVIGLVAETRCRFLASLGFPQALEAGIACARIGRSSVTYDLALFGAEEGAAALCRYVHVYVDAQTRRPIALPDSFRAALMALPEGIDRWAEADQVTAARA